jgi:hypothetical protein
LRTITPPYLGSRASPEPHDARAPTTRRDARPPRAGSSRCGGSTLEPWQVLQLFVVGDFWTCSCHARGALSGGKMSISHGCGGLMRALGHEKLPWRVVL